MRSFGLRMRTFNAAGNHELVLPSGKVVLIDPYFVNCRFPGFSVDDITGADYIILTHCHYDHDSDLGYLAKKFGAKVFCGVMSAEAVMKYHKIPYDNLFPVFPGSKFTLEDLTLEFWQAKHNEAGGRIWDPEANIGFQKAGMVGHQQLDMLGSMESLDFMLTTPGGFRLMMVSGRPLFGETFDRCRAAAPHVLLRQGGIRDAARPGQQVTEDEMAALLARYGAQIVVPFHTDIMEKKHGADWTRAYLRRVGEKLAEKAPGTLFLDPVPLKWYTFGVSVEEE